MGILIFYLLSFLSFFFLVILIHFFHKLWWTPIRIQSFMASQGIKGRPYRFLHGNTKEIINMTKQVMDTPLELSQCIFPKIHPHLFSWLKLYGRHFLYWYGPKLFLVITEPELIKEVLCNNDGTYRRPDAPDYWKKLFGDGLVISQGEKWLRQRKLATHAFHAESLKGMIPEMVTSVAIMLERWRKSEEKDIDVSQEFKVLTGEIISWTAFGSSYMEGQKIFDMLTQLVLIISRNAYNIRIPIIRTVDDIEADKLEEGIRDSILKIVKKREEIGKIEESNGNSDYLELLIRAYHHEDKAKRITTDDLVDECKTVYAAGEETTTSGLTWAIFMLAINTDWQERARIEVFQSFGQKDPTPDGITKLKTISMIINESLRLYPPGSYLTRKVAKQAKLGSFIVPKNTYVFIPTLAVHSDPEIWGEDAHVFNPERFAEGVAKATNNNTATFVPFGFGPRSCVGLNFAVLEIKIALSMILQRFKFLLSPSYVHSPVHRITLCPQHGLKIILQPL